MILKNTSYFYEMYSIDMNHVLYNINLFIVHYIFNFYFIRFNLKIILEFQRSTNEDK